MTAERTPVLPCLSTLLADPFAIDGPTFDATVDALVAAGADGVSWWTLHELLLASEDRTGDDVRARFFDAGLAVGCVEALHGWANAATPAAAVADAAPWLAIAAAHGAPHLVAVCLEPELASPDATVANLAAVADRAAEVDVTICVEFLPWTGIADLTTCWDLLRRSERTNVGVCLDAWHWHRQPGGPLGRHAETLASMPGWAVPLFQACDAGSEPWDDPMAECMAARPLPGEGEVDLGHLLGVLDDIGAVPMVCPEPFNPGMVADVGVDEAARLMVEATRAVLARS